MLVTTRTEIYLCKPETAPNIDISLLHGEASAKGIENRRDDVARVLCGGMGDVFKLCFEKQSLELEVSG
jgi:hypothetical protein